MHKNLAATFVAACFSLPIFSFNAQAQVAGGGAAAPGAAGAASTSKPLVNAAFVYVSPITEAGWTRQHDDARKAVEATLNKPGQPP